MLIGVFQWGKFQLGFNEWSNKTDWGPKFSRRNTRNKGSEENEG